jgi:hypothetical protein
MEEEGKEPVKTSLTMGRGVTATVMDSEDEGEEEVCGVRLLKKRH